MKGDNWYGYSRNQALNVIAKPKIFTPDLAPCPSFSYDSEGTIYFTGGAAGGYGVLLDSEYSIPSVLGILNSNVIGWYIQNTSSPMQGGWYSYEAKYIRSIPMPNNEIINKSEISTYVNKMLQLIGERKEASNKRDLQDIHREIKSCDRKINNLVCNLYDLDDEEIAIIDGSL